MITIHLLIYILALVCFFCAALNVPSPRVNLVAAGLFLWLLGVMVG